MPDTDLFLTDRVPTYARPAGLASLGSNSSFAEPYLIRSPHRIYIGRDVSIGSRAFLSVVEEIAGKRYEPTLRIGDGCIISSDLILHCMSEIEIGAGASIAARVYIGDSFRDYENRQDPPDETPYADPKPVRIRDHAFLGVGSVVLPGVTVGEYAIVSANAVVTADVPPRTVVLGNPARVVRSWDEETGEWVTGRPRKSGR